MPAHAAPTSHHVLVTGSAGAIGRVVAPALAARGHRVRGFDRAPSPHIVDTVTADLADRAAVDRAMDGIDTLVHLAAHPDNAPFVDTLLIPNVVGLIHVIESAVLAGVRRIVLASSIQAVNDRPADPAEPIPTDLRRPNNAYGLTKVWAEDLGEMVARIQGIEVIAVRPGWFPRSAGQMARVHDRRFAFMPRIFVSHDDTARFFIAAVEQPLDRTPGKPVFHVLYLVSGNGEPPIFDMQPARDLLGFEPRDRYPDGVSLPDQPAAEASSP